MPQPKSGQQPSKTTIQVDRRRASKAARGHREAGDGEIADGTMDHRLPPIHGYISRIGRGFHRLSTGPSHAPQRPAVNAKEPTMSHPAARRGFLAAAAALSAAVIAASAGGTATAAEPASTRAAAGCQADWRGSQLWAALQPDLHPNPASPAAFRLAEERSQILWQNAEADLRPSPTSPAAFRLADQRNLVAAAAACLSTAAAGPR
jgi:hypothetical protein